MTQTIEQLQAKVAELEEENARLKEIEQTNDTLLDQLGDKNAALLDEVASQKHCYAEAVAHYEKQLAASQAYAEQLREALVVLNKVSNIGCGRVYEALSLPASTEALDAYVAEKVNAKQLLIDAMGKQVQEFSDLLNAKIATLTRRRDLAVEALEWAADVLPPSDPGGIGVCDCPVCRALEAIAAIEVYEKGK